MIPAAPTLNFLASTLAGEPPPRGGVSGAGVTWSSPAEGVLEFLPPDLAARPADVMLSAGVHGDETAPIEMLDRLVADLVSDAQPLAVRLLVVLGNPAAMRAGKRYVDFDLNRLFGGAPRPGAAESARARKIEVLVRKFFAAAPAARAPLARWHLDLHTAVRPSLIERFALLPFQPDRPYSSRLLRCLAAGAVEALLENRGPAGTLSYWTSSRLAAESCTVELGKVRPFGANLRADFAPMEAALRALASWSEPAGDWRALRVFRVVGQLVRRSENFRLNLADDAPNFTTFASGATVAEDGGDGYVVGAREERVVFPNVKVALGLRAGLMVVEEPAARLRVA